MDSHYLNDIFCQIKYFYYNAFIASLLYQIYINDLFLFFSFSRKKLK